MTNLKAFEIALIKAGVTKKELAASLGISKQALYNKLNNIVEFKASEIIKTVDILKLSADERDEIFFNSNVAKYSTISA